MLKHLDQMMTRLGITYTQTTISHFTYSYLTISILQTIKLSKVCDNLQRISREKSRKQQITCYYWYLNTRQEH